MQLVTYQLTQQELQYRRHIKAYTTSYKPMGNKAVISWLFSRLVKTMPLGAFDSSMRNCPRPRAIIH